LIAAEKTKLRDSIEPWGQKIDALTAPHSTPGISTLSSDSLVIFVDKIRCINDLLDEPWIELPY
jgi:hypothetical protein